MPFFWHTLLKISLSYVLLLTTSLSYANPKTPLSPLVSAETALKDIVWESHDSSAEFGDPRAQKGGTFHSYLYSFPTTFRTFGLNTHHSANQLLRAHQLKLLTNHPNTLAFIPVLATHWAVDKSHKRVFYKLSPIARWSDGKKVTAEDYLFAYEMMTSPYIFSAEHNQLFGNIIKGVYKHSPQIISVATDQPYSKKILLHHTNIRPQPKHFYEVSKDWIKKYNWKIAPNTGAYRLSEYKKGSYLKLSRKHDWWAKDLKYFKYIYNIDHLVYTVIKDQDAIWNHFIKGDIHSYNLLDRHNWYEKSRNSAFTKGYIQKIWLYTNAPDGGGLIFLNQKQTHWQNKQLRRAFSHSLHFQKVIDHIFAGEYKRLEAFYTGYGSYSDKTIKARRYHPQRVSELMKAHGYHIGKKGYWQKDQDIFSVEILYGYGSITPWLTILKEEARKVGVKIILDLTSPSTYAKRIQQKKYDAVVSVLSPKTLTPHYREYFHSTSKPIHNLTSSHNTQLDRLIDNYDKEWDETKKADLSKQILHFIHNEAAFIPGFSVPFVRVGLWRGWKLPTPPGSKIFGFSSPEGHHMTSWMWHDPKEHLQLKKAQKDNQSLLGVTITDTTFKE